GIDGVHRGTIIGLSSFDAALEELVCLLAHARWIRTASRRDAKSVNGPSVGAEPTGIASNLTARANILTARRQDAREGRSSPAASPELKGLLSKSSPILNVVELFSGAGGMGLGVLLGGGERARFRIVYSGEANPTFVQTLRQNHT